MIGPHEPARKVDMSKWEAGWARIRENQARQRAEAEAAEQKLRAWVKSAETAEPRVDETPEES